MHFKQVYGAAVYGAAVRVGADAKLNVSFSSFSFNKADYGGVIYAEGSAWPFTLIFFSASKARVETLSALLIAM